jgi:hypothetical protein
LKCHRRRWSTPVRAGNFELSQFRSISHLEGQIEPDSKIQLWGAMRSRLVLIVLLTAACAPAVKGATETSPAQPDRVLATDDRTGVSIRATSDGAATRVTLAATADDVFNAVTSSYAMLKVPVTYADKGIGEQGNKKFVMSRMFDRQPVSAYLNCGDDPFGGPNANANPVQYRSSRVRGLQAVRAPFWRRWFQA